MRRAALHCVVAVAAVWAASAALSRPFFDPRADMREAVEADPADGFQLLAGRN